jgi:glycosyltransferase involved in cell wall biosynthesis
MPLLGFLSISQPTVLSSSMSPQTADISVVTVVLNDKSGLEGAISSVQRQRSLAIEHLIVDGGSIDGSAELARKFSSVLIDSKPDGGIYPAMQRGAARATGEFLIFCNSGDMLFGEDFLANAIRQLRNEKSLWGFGPIIELTQRDTYAWVSAPSYADSKSIISRKVFVPFPSFIIDRNLFLQLGGLTDQFKIAGDFELICKTANTSNPSIFRDPVALFTAGGISYVSADLAWKEEIAIRIKLFDLSFLDRCKQWFKFLIRLARWKTGKILDLIQTHSPFRISSWREYRTNPVPTEYAKFLTE